MGRGLMVVATGQHVGKTTTCLGLVSGLIDKGQKVSFLKPVGQSWVEVDLPPPTRYEQHAQQKKLAQGEAPCAKMRVDKDCILFKEKFKLECPYTRMSPVLIPAGYTKLFVDGKTERPEEHLEKVKKDYAYLKENSDIVVVEGTGHAGVGTIIELNNARIAKELGLKVLLIGTGGLGNAIDTLALSKAVLDQEGVDIAGVVLNKCIPNKPDIPEYVRKVVEDRWGLPFLGHIPHNKILSQPTMKDMEILFKSKLIAAESESLRRIDEVNLIASSVGSFMTQLNKAHQLFVTPSSRTDILFALIADLKTGGLAGKCGLILTGNHPTHASKVIERLQAEKIPTLILPHMTSVQVVSSIAQFTAKIRFEDDEKINRAVKVVTDSIDFERLLASAA